MVMEKQSYFFGYKLLNTIFERFCLQHILKFKLEKIFQFRANQLGQQLTELSSKQIKTLKNQLDPASQQQTLSQKLKKCFQLTAEQFERFKLTVPKLLSQRTTILMGYCPLVDFHQFFLTEWFPITTSAIQPIGTSSTFCNI